MNLKRKLITIFFTAFLAACVPEQSADPTALPDGVSAQPTSTDLPPTTTATATSTATATPEPTATLQPTARPDASDLIPAALLSNLSYGGLLDGEPVSLSNGRYQLTSGSAAEITLSDKIAHGYIGGRPYAAVVLSSEAEDSGSQYSLHVVGLEKDKPVEIAHAALEDAVRVDSLMIAFDQIAAELVTAGAFDGNCCPSQLVVQLFQLDGNSLKRTANEVVGVMPESEQRAFIATATAAAVESHTQVNDTAASEEGLIAATAEIEATPQAEATPPAEAVPQTEATPQAESTPGGEVTVDGEETAGETVVSAASGVEAEAAETAAADLSLPPGVQPGSVLELSEGGVSITTTGLASGWYWRVRPERTTPREPETQIYPEHMMIVFGDDNIVDVAANNGRRVLIFPLHNYLDFSAQNGLSETGEQVARLQTLINEAGERSSRPRGTMPLLPQPGGLVRDWSNFRYLDFNDGRGVRYVWEGDGDIYAYQGITDDGRYYVSLLWPLEAGYDDSLIEQLDAMVATLDFGY